MYVHFYSFSLSYLYFTIVVYGLYSLLINLYTYIYLLWLLSILLCCFICIELVDSFAFFVYVLDVFFFFQSSHIKGNEKILSAVDLRLWTFSGR